MQFTGAFGRAVRDPENARREVPVILNISAASVRNSEDALGAPSVILKMCAVCCAQFWRHMAVTSREVRAQAQAQVSTHEHRNRRRHAHQLTRTSIGPSTDAAADAATCTHAISGASTSASFHANTGGNAAACARAAIFQCYWRHLYLHTVFEARKAPPLFERHCASAVLETFGSYRPQF